MPQENTAAPPRQFALMVSEEEAEALTHVLLLAPMEDGAGGAATDRLLSRLTELQRAFGREENPQRVFPTQKRLFLYPVASGYR